MKWARVTTGAEANVKVMPDSGLVTFSRAGDAY